MNMNPHPQSVTLEQAPASVSLCVRVSQKNSVRKKLIKKITIASSLLFSPLLSSPPLPSTSQNIIPYQICKRLSVSQSFLLSSQETHLSRSEQDKQTDTQHWKEERESPIQSYVHSHPHPHLHLHAQHQISNHHPSAASKKPQGESDR